MSSEATWHRRPWTNPEQLYRGASTDWVVEALIDDWQQYAAEDDHWWGYPLIREAKARGTAYEHRKEVAELYHLGAVELIVRNRRSSRRARCRFTPEALAHPDITEAIWLDSAGAL